MDPESAPSQGEQRTLALALSAGSSSLQRSLAIWGQGLFVWGSVGVLVELAVVRHATCSVVFKTLLHNEVCLT